MMATTHKDFGEPQANAFHAYMASLGCENSRRRMTSALRIFIQQITNCEHLCKCADCDPEFFDWSSVRWQATQPAFSRLKGQFNMGIYNSCCAATRSVLGVAWRLRLMTAEACWRAQEQIRCISTPTVLSGKIVSEFEIRKVFRVCDLSTIQGSRDAAVFAVLRAGLQREELIWLDVDDIIRSGSGKIFLSIRHGRGRKQRMAPMPAGYESYVDVWLKFRGDNSGPLFYASDGIGHGFRSPRRPSSTAIYQLCRRLARRAGVDPFSPFDMRRTRITELLVAGESILKIAKWMGHASVNTTQKYDIEETEAE